jgi:hypothetical protein
MMTMNLAYRPRRRTSILPWYHCRSEHVKKLRRS